MTTDTTPRTALLYVHRKTCKKTGNLIITVSPFLGENFTTRQQLVLHTAWVTAVSDTFMRTLHKIRQGFRRSLTHREPTVVISVDQKSADPDELSMLWTHFIGELYKLRYAVVTTD